jgi:protein TonB
MTKDFDLTSPKWLDLMFEKRNRQYGAYELRNDSSNRHIKAMLLVTIVFLAVIYLPNVIKNVLPAAKQVEQVTAVNMSDLNMDQEIPEENQMQAEIVPPPPLLKATQQFTEAVVVKDEEVREEDLMLAQQDLSELDTEISTQTIVGDKDAGVNIADVKDHKVIVEKPEETIYQHVEQMPEFKGGQAELMKWLNANLEYPVIAQENGVQGTVTVRFVVKPDGSIGDPQIVKGLDPSCDKEALRVLKKMPNWVPGRQNGNAVSVYFNLPIRFRLQDR